MDLSKPNPEQQPQQQQQQTGFVRGQIRPSTHRIAVRLTDSDEILHQTSSGSPPISDETKNMSDAAAAIKKPESPSPEGGSPESVTSSRPSIPRKPTLSTGGANPMATSVAAKPALPRKATVSMNPNSPIPANSNVTSSNSVAESASSAAGVNPIPVSRRWPPEPLKSNTSGSVVVEKPSIRRPTAVAVGNDQFFKSSSQQPRPTVSNTAQRSPTVSTLSFLLQSNSLRLIID